VGVLRGFDQFMNIVLDNSVEVTKGGEENEIGMVVSASVSASYSVLWILFLLPRKGLIMNGVVDKSRWRGKGANPGASFQLLITLCKSVPCCERQ
jgi:hypothetical protein